MEISTHTLLFAAQTRPTTTTNTNIDRIEEEKGGGMAKDKEKGGPISIITTPPTNKRTSSLASSSAGEGDVVHAIEFSYSGGSSARGSGSGIVTTTTSSTSGVAAAATATAVSSSDDVDIEVFDKQKTLTIKNIFSGDITYFNLHFVCLFVCHVHTTTNTREYFFCSLSLSSHINRYCIRNDSLFFSVDAELGKEHQLAAGGSHALLISPNISALYKNKKLFLNVSYSRVFL